MPRPFLAVVLLAMLLASPARPAGDPDQPSIDNWWCDAYSASGGSCVGCGMLCNILRIWELTQFEW